MTLQSNRTSTDPNATQTLQGLKLNKTATPSNISQITDRSALTTKSITSKNRNHFKRSHNEGYTMTSLDISYDENANHTFSMDYTRLTEQVPNKLSTI